MLKSYSGNKATRAVPVTRLVSLVGKSIALIKFITGFSTCEGPGAALLLLLAKQLGTGVYSSLILRYWGSRSSTGATEALAKQQGIQVYRLVQYCTCVLTRRIETGHVSVHVSTANFLILPIYSNWVSLKQIK